MLRASLACSVSAAAPFAFAHSFVLSKKRCTDNGVSFGGHSHTFVQRVAAFRPPYGSDAGSSVPLKADDLGLLAAPPPWLRELESPAVVQELRTLADADEAGGAPAPQLFTARFGPNTHLAGPRADDWQALPLMNKGALLPDGCAKAPATCAVLARMQGHLRPGGPTSSEVGGRLLMLAPGARLSPHRGPGGRLVAHLGVKIPPTSFLTVSGQRLRWREGGFIVFDDSVLHSAENPSARARYILHVAFPAPAQQVLAAGVSAAGDRDEAVVASIAASGVRLVVYSNCSAVATNTRNGRSSVPEPLLLLYNRVADNRPQDWDPCVRATALGNHTVRIFADHGYGSVDIGVVAFPRWLRFEVLSLTMWHADPVQKHLQFTSLCPTDLCTTRGTDPQFPAPGGNPGSSFPYSFSNPPFGLSSSSSSTQPGSRHVPGTFTGWTGGGFSAGFLTITSNWQMAATMWYAKVGWRLVYTIVPEDDVPAVITDVNKAEGIPSESQNRGKSWLWVQGLTTTNNLNATITLAKALGVQVVFLSDMTGPGMNGYLTNVGDYTVNKQAWPNGLGEIATRLAPHGLEVGFHMLSSGTAVCMDQMTGPDAPGQPPGGPWYIWPSRLGSCKGNIMMDTVVSRTRPELFVPQGITNRVYNPAITAGTWPCHEKSGGGCGDVTRQPWPGPGGIAPLTPAERAKTCEASKPPCLPSNPLVPLRQTFLFLLSPFRSTDVFGGAGTRQHEHGDHVVEQARSL